MSVKATVILKEGFNTSDYDFAVKDANGAVLKPVQPSTEFNDVGDGSNSYIAKRKADAKEFAEPKRKNLGGLAKTVTNPNAPCAIVFVRFKKTGTTEGNTVGGKTYIAGSMTTAPATTTSPSVTGTPAPVTTNEEIATPAEIAEIVADLQEQVNENPIDDILLEEV